MFFEMVFLVYMVFGLLIWSKGQIHILEHANKVAVNPFTRRIILVAGFLITVFCWPAIILFEPDEEDDK